MKSRLNISAVLQFLVWITFLLIQIVHSREYSTEVQDIHKNNENPLFLETVTTEEAGKVSKGVFKVFENRDSQTGRVLELDFVILHARSIHPLPDPVFILMGGPGVAATRYAGSYEGSWLRQDRDVVLIDQRGTGGTHALNCKLPGNDDNIQGYLEPLFDAQAFCSCLKELKKRADLTWYSTPIAVDDFDEFREALGYQHINLIGHSYGTRAVLVYMRRHADRIRTVILNGIDPLKFKNPLYHAKSAQDALAALFDECMKDPDCNRAFPQLRQEFVKIMARLTEKPALVTVSHLVTNERVQVKLSREAFGEALRMMLYNLDTQRKVPYLIHRAYKGDYESFAQLGINNNRRIRQLISFGLLLCVTCAEDVTRINPEEIVSLTEGTFLGDDRIRQQMAVCDFWPRSDLPRDYADPIIEDIPVLILSGTLDPVTPPWIGTQKAKQLPRCYHLIVPGAHSVDDPCIDKIEKRFLNTTSVEGLDTSCVEEIKLPPYFISASHKIDVKVHPAVELISIIFRLAGNPEYKSSKFWSYCKDVDHKFAAFRNHGAIQLAQKLRESLSISYNAPIGLALHLNGQFPYEQRLSLHPVPDGIDNRWTSEAIREFIPLVRDFSLKSSFDEFMVQQQGVHETAVERMKGLLEEFDVASWFKTFFQSDSISKFTVMVSMLTNGYFYGPYVKLPNGNLERYAVIGVGPLDQDGLPVFGKFVLPYVIHEFSHSFINPIVDKHIAQLADVGQQLFEHVENDLPKTYSSWKIMLYESLVRAVTIRYLESIEELELAKRSTQQDCDEGFTWTKELAEVLTEYENQRNRFRDFNEFLPRIRGFIEKIISRKKGHI